MTTVTQSVLTSYVPEDASHSITVVNDIVVSSAEPRRSEGTARVEPGMVSRQPLPHRAPPVLTGALSDRAALLHELIDAHSRKDTSKTDERPLDAGQQAERRSVLSEVPSPLGSTAVSGRTPTAAPMLTGSVPSVSPWSSGGEQREEREEVDGAPAERTAAREMSRVSERHQSTPHAQRTVGVGASKDSTDTAAEQRATSGSIAASDDGDDADELVDTRQIGNYVGFLLGSVRRHWLAFSAITLLMASAIAAGTVIWPKSYQVYATLLVQRNEKMASLVNPGRTISREAESPTRAAEQIVLQQMNLRALIEQTDLIFRWEQTRTPLLKLKDRLFGYIRPPQTKDQRVDSMVGLLEARLKVYTTPEGSVTFELRWPEPQAAYDIVDHAVQNFLDFRKQSEVSAIADSISILDQSVESLEEKVRQTIAELPRRRPATVVRRPVEPTRDVAPSALAATVTPQAPPADLLNRLTRMKTEIEARRREVTRLEDLHRQQLSEAQTRLAAAKTVYGDDFPTVIALRQTVDQLTRESPELTSLRRDAQAAEAEYDTLAAALQTSNSNGTVSSGLPPELQLRPTPRASTEPAPLEVSLADTTNAEMSDPTTLRLRVELAELAAVRGRANAARAELSSSQAGFKYQYTIITPPQMPRGPISPNVPAFVGGGIVASLLLALLAVVMADLLTDRFLESWQVEHHLGVPVALSVQERG